MKESRTDTSASREIELKLTDEAVSEVAPVIRYLTQPSAYQPASKQLPLLGEDLDEGDANSSVPEKVESVPEEVENSSEGEPKEERVLSDATGTGSMATKLFTQDDQFLAPRLSDFKGDTKKAQQQRFVLLYVWAYPMIIGESSLSKSHVMGAAKKAGLYDRNLSQKYFDEVKGQYFLKAGDGFQVNMSGEQRVKTIISEIMNDEIKGKEYWKPKSTRKRHSLSKQDRNLISEWVEKPSRGDNFEVRSLENIYDYALLAIYDLTKELEVVPRVKPIVAFEYLTSRYEQVPVTKKSFRDCLSRSKYRHLFKKTEDGEYYLTEEAEKIVKEWLNSKRRTG